MNIFLDHPRSVGEGWWRHLFTALRISIILLLSSLAALIHAFLPFLFETTASRSIKKLTQELVSREHKNHMVRWKLELN